MGNSFEISFIPQTVEKTPFADVPTQIFFAEWCRINDSIVPKFISREEWGQRGAQGILEKNDQGKQTLFLPTDLHLWEIMDVIKTVDHDTLARNPEKRAERANQIQELGITFEKAGIYLKKYLGAIQPINEERLNRTYLKSKKDEHGQKIADDDGSPIFEERTLTEKEKERAINKSEEETNKAKQIAQDIAREFYNYGLSLQHKKQETMDIPEELSLTEEDKTKLDEWFLGRDVYQKRITGLGKNPTKDQIEDSRKKLLQIYFKALGREGHKADGEKPWETKVGPMQHLQDKTKRQITKAIETPEREMKTAIFRRGMEKLATEMKEVGWRRAVNNLLKKIGFDPLLEQRRLYDTLHIDVLKKELEEVRKTGDVVKISTKELEIAKKIQRVVSSFPYRENGNNPSEMIETQFINCVGSSILGGGLLDKTGIKYLHADLPEHSATVLITSDGKLRWQDLTPGGPLWNYKEITDKDITGKNKNEQPLTVADIVAFANNPSNEGIRFEINRWWYNLNMEKIKMPNRHIGLFNPEIGLQSHLLCHLYNYFNNTNRLKAALATIDFIEQLCGSANILPVKFGLGNALSDLGRNKEAIEAYKQAISIHPKFTHPYYRLGRSLSNLGRNKEAIEAYKQIINIDPKDAYAYYGLGNILSDLGKNEEAIEAYQQFIKLRNGNKPLINRAKEKIEKLKQK